MDDALEILWFCLLHEKELNLLGHGHTNPRELCAPVEKEKYEQILRLEKNRFYGGRELGRQALRESRGRVF